MTIKYLHDGIFKPLNLGGLAEARESDVYLIISDSKLCEFLSPQETLMTKQRRDLCGCEFTFSNITTRSSKCMQIKTYDLS